MNVYHIILLIVFIIIFLSCLLHDNSIEDDDWTI
jgi:hypothetical protein